MAALRKRGRVLAIGPLRAVRFSGLCCAGAGPVGALVQDRPIDQGLGAVALDTALTAHLQQAQKVRRFAVSALGLPDNWCFRVAQQHDADTRGEAPILAKLLACQLHGRYDHDHRHQIRLGILAGRKRVTARLYASLPAQAGRRDAATRNEHGTTRARAVDAGDAR